MKIFLLGLQIVFAVAAVVLVLLHAAKGEGMGGIGGQARIFGSQKGLEEGLDKITAICAALFILVSIVLSLL
jgi:preprotein translocase subunit SecG